MCQKEILFLNLYHPRRKSIDVDNSPISRAQSSGWHGGPNKYLWNEWAKQCTSCTLQNFISLSGFFFGGAGGGIQEAFPNGALEYKTEVFITVAGSHFNDQWTTDWGSQVITIARKLSNLWTNLTHSHPNDPLWLASCVSTGLFFFLSSFRYSHLQYSSKTDSSKDLRFPIDHQFPLDWQALSCECKDSIQGLF